MYSTYGNESRVNTLRPRQNCRHPSDIVIMKMFEFRPIISLKFAPKIPIDNKPALFQIVVHDNRRQAIN